MNQDRLVRQLGNWTELRGPLHARLGSALQNAIRLGTLLPGVRLPAERILAQSLAVSRTTVLAAYNNLKSDGWLESRPGSGTWVRAQPAAQARQQAYEAVLDGSSTLNLLQVDDSELIDFAVGATKPLAELQADVYSLPPSVQSALLEERHYLPLGLPALRQALADYYTKRNLPTTPEQILVTNGAQQGIALVVSSMVQRGDAVLVENPTFFGTLDVLRFSGARLTSLPVEAEHVRPVDVRERLALTGARLVALTPAFHNPTGRNMPNASRAEMAQISAEFSVPILEDHSLREFELEEEGNSFIAEHAPRGADVITLGSLSKLFWGGLRIGWLRAPVSTLAKIARVKTAADLGSAILTQAIAVQLLRVMDEAKAIRKSQFLEGRGVLVELLRKALPEWRFEVPKGGLFLWIRLPGYDARQFAQVAARHGVALTPGSLFAADETSIEYLRIPYVLEKEKLRLGVERLAKAWDVFLSSAHFRARDVNALV